MIWPIMFSAQLFYVCARLPAAVTIQTNHTSKVRLKMFSLKDLIRYRVRALTTPCGFHNFDDRSITGSFPIVLGDIPS